MAPTPAVASNRLPGADLLRALATVGVVAIHTAQWPWVHSKQERLFWNDVGQAFRFAVPAFIVLSGIVLAYRYGEARLPPGFLARRARRSVLPFAVWAPFYLVFGTYVTHEVMPTRTAILDWWLWGAGHLYFLLIIPQFYLLYMVWPRRRDWLPGVTGAALALQLGLCAWRLYGRVPPGLAWSLTMNHGYEFFPFWAGYFAGGLWVGTLCAGRWSAPPAALGRIALVAIPVTAAPFMFWGTTGSPYPAYGQGTGGFLVPLLVPLVFAICIACLVSGGAWFVRRGALVRGIITTVSTYSLGIYILHPFLLQAPGHVLRDPLVHDRLPGVILPDVALFVATLLMSIGCVRLLAATPLAPTLGVPRAGISRPTWR